MSYNCSTDLDCPGTLVCYTNELSWFESVYGSDITSTCDCSTWYAWTGDDCDEISTHTYVYLVIQGCVSLVSICWATVGVYVLFRLFSVQQEGKFFNASNITAIYSTVALIVLATYRTLLMVIYASPTKYTYTVSEDTDKYTDYTMGDRVLACLTALFATLCALNVSLMWIQVANTSKKFRRQATYLGFYRKLILVFEVIFTIILIILLGLNMPSYATIAAFPFIVFVEITFFIGQLRMTRLLHSMTTSYSASVDNNTSKDDEPSFNNSKQESEASTKTRKYKSMMRLIRNTSRMVIGWGLVTLGAGASYAVLSMNWKAYGKPGHVNSAAAMNEVFSIGILGVVSTVQWYIWRVIRARTRRIRKQITEFKTASKEDNSFTNTFSVNPTFNNKPGSTQPVVPYQQRFQEGAASFHADYYEDEPEKKHHDPNDDYV